MSDDRMPAGKSPEESLVTECELPHAPEKVWRALTQPEIVAGWLLPGDIATEPGRRFSFRADEHEASRVDCEVLDSVPERLLRYSWRDDLARREGLTSTVTFELLPRDDGGTSLRVVHDGFRRIEARGESMPPAANTNEPLMMRLAA